MGSRQLYACDYEVFGKVQHVFFRKYAEKKAKELGLHGWIMNTQDGTVKGTIEGTQNELGNMKDWLSTKGSPKSSIDKANFTNLRPIHTYSFKTFEIKK
ncbi:acylphosphatase-1-like [Lucilia cuprina]|uniref:acylphosphatase-1-like n=1 Tax=Lucilia sericata TaxID=13632 RepID=UPI0018A81FAE|nr:acylphosphatase-1-like [Lucilia sericata]XP_046807648.1 acylphosphatase-1-like [Lucilia cuprina]